MAGLTSEEYAEQEARRAALMNRERRSASGKLYGWEVIRRDIEAAMVLADLEAGGEGRLGYHQMSTIATQAFLGWLPSAPIRLPEDP